MRIHPLLRASLAAAALASLLASAANANVLIDVDKSTQQMNVSVDGVPRYQFTVSTGRPGYGTPSGTFHPQRMERSWFSKEYYNSPMPHSIFFHGGFAIHGSYEISRLGGPASHGCIRLHPENAATLYALVQQQGMAATTIVVSGESGGVARRRAPAESDYQTQPASVPPGYGQRYAPSYQPYYQQQPGYYQQQPRGYGYPNGY
jgi:lipoprotein-anchoring transpeptidase ErfK/SrfK